MKMYETAKSLIYRKDLGVARIMPNVNVVAGSVGSWKIKYTVGESGINKGGKVSFGIPHGFSIPQVDNSYMPGYCSASCSRKGIGLVLRCTRSSAEMFSYKSGIYGNVSRGVLVHICEEKLLAGDVINFHYGNKSVNNSGSFVRAIEGPAEFTILVCPEDAWEDDAHFYFLESSPVLQVVAREPRKIHVTLPSITRISENFPIHISAKDEFDNTSSMNDISLILIGKDALKDLTRDIHLKGQCVETQAQSHLAGVGRCVIDAAYSKSLSLETNPILVEKDKDLSLYWGDLHLHTYISDGFNTPAYAYQYAQDVEKANFAAVTDHCCMTDEGWRECMEAAEQYNKDHKFVTFLGFEHTTWTNEIHRNIYFKGSASDIIRAGIGGEDVLRAKLAGYSNGVEYVSQYKSVSSSPELFANLDKEKVIVIPHIHHMDWQHHDPSFESVVEIYSSWGSRELSGCRYASVSNCMANETVQYALNLGYRLGFVAGGDGHAGRPGKDFWLRVRGARSCGITGIFAKELTRQALWDAIKTRRCYATTGKRIIVKFHLNGKMMGSEVGLSSSNQSRRIDVEIYGTTRIDKVTIVKNGTDTFIKEPRIDETKFDWSDKKQAQSGDYYYLRIEQVDRAMAWSSPIWIDLDNNEN